MFGRGFRLFSVFGIPIKVDVSWFLIVVLITWSLATGLFPSIYGDAIGPGVYWAMGVCGALGLFGSVLAHELGHARVAQSQGVPMAGITLFIFGGVAEMTRDASSPKAEFLVAIAGPIVSVVLGLAMGGLSMVAMPAPAAGVVGYLAVINLALVPFNLIPAFPLDGGRVLRSALWAWKGDNVWATRVCARIGSGFGMAMIVIGVLSMVTDRFGGVYQGIWWIILGLFLRGVAKASYQQVLTREVLEEKNVSDLMNPDPVTVSPGLTLERFVEDYVYHYHHKLYPAVEDGRLWGCINAEQLRDIDRTQWATRHVREFTADCDLSNTVHVDAPATEALRVMSQEQTSRLMVVDDEAHEHLVGIIAMRDLIGYLQWHEQVEPAGPGAKSGASGGGGAAPREKKKSRADEVGVSRRGL